MSVRLGDENIQQITAMTVGQASEFITGLQFDKEQRLIADPITAEILQRLKFLEKVGADYLSLDRSADTLSWRRNCSEFDWQPALGPGWWEFVTYWMNHQSGCITVITTG